MNIYNIERNKLDYILTDLLPLELSELFSLNDFYEYLLDNKKILDKLVLILKKKIALNKDIPFKNGWATAPLKFNILKGNDSVREMSLMQPLSMLNIFFFLECYQKELLIKLKENSVFSLRYHSKNNSLYYKKRIKKVTEYYSDTAKKIDKGIIQQTGVYFKIRPFNSVAAFTGSRKWQQLNFQYSHFARMDYKSCFDSIYTHTYKWIIQKNVVESKDAKNSNLYITIDRVLQNINSKSSNGILVGPEFSRMIVEVLLQEIDVEVMNDLLLKGYKKNIDYNIYRYVDDIFIFANGESVIREIIFTITQIAQKYLLHPNDNKLITTKTPFTLNNWLARTRGFSEKISALFHNKTELQQLEDDEKYLIRGGYIAIEKLKSEFNSLVCDFPSEKRTIVSFALSTLLNNISRKKDGITLFKDTNNNRALHLLDLTLYIMAFCPCFEHIQRVISIFVYFNDELKFCDDEFLHNKLQSLFDKYAFVFLRGNLNDICNLFLFYHEFKLVIPYNIEVDVFEKIKNTNNPILLAVYLVYSKYHTPYFSKIKDDVETIIERNINHITKGEEMLQMEFWYILIFINCPFIKDTLKNKMKNIVDRIYINDAEYPSGITINLICDYLKTEKNNLFFSWGVHHFSVSKQIAFRTYQRSIFREYKNRNSQMIYGSVE